MAAVTLRLVRETDYLERITALGETLRAEAELRQLWAEGQERPEFARALLLVARARRERAIAAPLPGGKAAIRARASPLNVPSG